MNPVKVYGWYLVLVIRKPAFCSCENIDTNELRCEKTKFFAYAKTKTQISFAVTAKLISAFVFATKIYNPSTSYI